MPRIMPRICALAENMVSMTIINNNKGIIHLPEGLFPCCDMM